MNNAFGVGSGEGVGYLNSDIEQLLNVHGLATNVLLEAVPLQLFHDDEGMAVMILDFVDGADAGMVQQGGGAGLALEALHGFAVAGEIIGKKLDGDVAAEPHVFRFVDHAHAAAAQLTQNAVMGDRLADHGRTARTLAGRFAVHGEAQSL